MSVYERAETIVELLTAAGIRATLDPRNINPPCVYVREPELAYDVYAGHTTATWTVAAIVPGPRSADTFHALHGAGGLVPAVDAVLDVQGGRPGTDTDNPTFEMTFQEAI